jgi:hypothetical protein
MIARNDKSIQKLRGSPKIIEVMDKVMMTSNNPIGDFLKERST